VPDFNTGIWETRRAYTGRHHADPCRHPFSYDEARLNHACNFNQCLYCSAYVFTRDIAGSATSRWTQRAKLVAHDSRKGDRFGSSVAVCDDTIVIGAPGADTSRGAAYIFTRDVVGSVTSSWTLRAKLFTASRGRHEWFGSSVSVSGDTAVVGARYDDDKVRRSELKRVFAPSE
jgi:head-tail adaptor